MIRLRRWLRLMGRIVVMGVVVTLVTVVGLQYARIIAKNISMARQLASTQDEIRALQVGQREAELTIRRLSDPQGAIPEIHDKLHLVRDHETIIYLQRDNGP